MSAPPANCLPLLPLISTCSAALCQPRSPPHNPQPAAREIKRRARAVLQGSIHGTFGPQQGKRGDITTACSSASITVSEYSRTFSSASDSLYCTCVSFGIYSRTVFRRHSPRQLRKCVSRVFLIGKYFEGVLFGKWSVNGNRDMVPCNPRPFMVVLPVSDKWDPRELHLHL